MHQSHPMHNLHGVDPGQQMQQIQMNNLHSTAILYIKRVYKLSQVIKVVQLDKKHPANQQLRPGESFDKTNTFIPSK